MVVLYCYCIRIILITDYCIGFVFVSKSPYWSTLGRYPFYPFIPTHFRQVRPIYFHAIHFNTDWLDKYVQLLFVKIGVQSLICTGHTKSKTRGERYRVVMLIKLSIYQLVLWTNLHLINYSVFITIKLILFLSHFALFILT